MQKISQIGLGYWGRNILRNLSELNLIQYACDLNHQIIDEHKKSFPQIHFTSDINKIITDPEVKNVVVSTPAATHFDLVKKLLSAGKNVFVEKPLALTVKDGEDLVRLAQKNKKILMVGHILQYHPALIKLRELIQAGELGKLQYIYSNRLNIGKLRTEENILWSFAPHDISIILELIGNEPISVDSWGEGYLNDHIYDTTMTCLTFKNKIKAHIFVSWLHPFKEQKLVVVGSNAMAVFDDMSKEKLFIYPHKITWAGGNIPVAQKAEAKIIAFEQKEPLKEEILHFIDCVSKQKTPKTDGQEGLRVLKILEAAEKSLKEKRHVR